MGVWRERLTRQRLQFFLIRGARPKGNALHMIILPLLLAPILAGLQTAPATPPTAEASTIVYAPSRSLRSATAAAATGLPATPVTIRFECLVLDSGAPVRCLPLEGGAKPTPSVDEFEKRYIAWPRVSAIAPVAVALQRVLFTRVRPLVEPGKNAPPVLMLFSDTVSAGDVVTLGKSGGDLAIGDIEMDERPDAAVLTAYYPPAAIREGISARTSATCRVMPDRKLFCRNAAAGPDSSITPDMAADFANATYQVLDSIRLSPLSKAGDPVVGRDVEMRISFVLPN
jgi:hypothetical protein